MALVAAWQNACLQPTCRLSETDRSFEKTDLSVVRNRPLCCSRQTTTIYGSSDKFVVSIH